MSEARSSISPTAHYTGAVWTRHGLSHPALATSTGKLMYHGMRPSNAVSRLLRGPALEDFLIARHRLIDRLLEAAIDRGEVSQVIELAAGLSPRGWRFSKRFGDRLTYVETDLPGMVAQKRAALEQANSLSASHRVVVLDALSDGGEHSLDAVASQLDRDRGLAIITEGLLSYLDRPSVDGLWMRIAATLCAFDHGVYLSDLHLAGENAGLASDVFMLMLGLFVRGRVELHFDDEAETQAALSDAGFSRAGLHRGAEVVDARGAQFVRVIEARPARS